MTRRRRLGETFRHLDVRLKLAALTPDEARTLTDREIMTMRLLIAHGFAPAEGVLALIKELELRPHLVAVRRPEDVPHVPPKSSREASSLGPLFLVWLFIKALATTRGHFGVLDFIGLLVPKRIADEEIGDARELIARLGLTGWRRGLKEWSATFWVLVNAVREVAAALLGKKKGGG